MKMGESVLIGARWGKPEGRDDGSLGGDWKEDRSRLAVVFREEAKRSEVLEGSSASQLLVDRFRSALKGAQAVVRGFVVIQEEGGLRDGAPSRRGSSPQQPSSPPPKGPTPTH